MRRPRKRAADPAAGRPRLMTPDYWPQATAHLRAGDPVLARIIAAYPRERLVCREDPFGTLARAIVGQQVSVKSASSVWRRVEQALGEVTWQALGAAPEEALSGCGLSRQKLRYLYDLAGRFLSGEVVPACWPGMDDEQVIAGLTQVKGIGRWTAEMFLIFHLLRPDVLPLADIGLQRAMGVNYGDGGKPSESEMKRIAAPWRPWRSVATWYLWRSLDPVPVEY